MSSQAEISIHHRPRSFSERWIERLDMLGIRYNQVDCFDPGLLKRLAGSRALLWHWDLNNTAELLAARSIIRAVEDAGVIAFPSSPTCWHYDDKVAQKYVLEAVGAPYAATYVFFDQARAMEWIAQTSFPKVFKLRCGAGSTNVRLVATRSHAEKLCRTAFGRGFVASPGYLTDLRHKIRRTDTAGKLWQKLRRLPTTLLCLSARRHSLPRERGYVLFQDFLAGNAYDTRVTVIGNRAFAFRRFNRPGDFRASGSGLIDHSPDEIDLRCVDAAFQAADRMQAQCLAFDFLFDGDGNPRINEFSYAFLAQYVHACPGHWDRTLTWRQGHVWPQDAILDDLLAAIGMPGSEHIGAHSILAV